MGLFVAFFMKLQIHDFLKQLFPNISVRPFAEYNRPFSVESPIGTQITKHGLVGKTIFSLAFRLASSHLSSKVLAQLGSAPGDLSQALELECWS